jgi:two-component sensor histidine kinase
VLNKLAAMVAAANASEGQQIAVNVQAEPLSLPSKKATSLALVANELIANALRHAFPGRSRGRVEVTLAQHDREVLLEVADDGVGLPADFDLRRDARTGLRVGQRLVERDLRGELTLDRDGGTRAAVRFPL